MFTTHPLFTDLSAAYDASDWDAVAAIKAEMLALADPAMLAAVKAHALTHYEQGWDPIVEAYEDHELALEIADCASASAAIAQLAKGLDLRADYAHDIRAAGDIVEPVPTPVARAVKATRMVKLAPTPVPDPHRIRNEINRAVRALYADGYLPYEMKAAIDEIVAGITAEAART